MIKPVLLKDLCHVTGGTLSGNSDLLIGGVNTLEDAREGDISFIYQKTFLVQLLNSEASAFVVEQGLDLPENFECPEVKHGIIRVKNARAAFAKIAAYLIPPKIYNGKIHPGAVIADSTKPGRNVTVYPFAVIGENCTIGNNCVIYPGVSIGDNVKIGEDTVIYANVSIYDRTVIGARCIISANVVIGSDGFGYYQEGGHHIKIPHFGNVVIEDDVEIGSGTTIDRATYGSTVISKGTKIDNLVQVAHNVKIGAHNLALGQSGYAGSAKTVEGCILGAKAGVGPGTSVHAGTQIFQSTLVLKDITQPMQVRGEIARPLNEYMRAQANLYLLDSKLDKLHERIKQLEIQLAQRQQSVILHFGQVMRHHRNLALSGHLLA
ncbi:hypothetical protein CHS0354_002012 [Potamilus streckersoni]|uniref:UDP-3-O-[3-hydroxymyristoyl] glucosamine N-acyltransferase non-repeat region domain-containing protein n=1 Tax=Potamilus streckersoni TaxID=2493646 RepID=A0AAE0T6F1_9BIVA|nr:hypothetical protein CHS0354_002012 [Potamilus streckersoni]